MRFHQATRVALVADGLGAPSTVDSSSAVTATQPSSVAPHSSDDDREEEAPPQNKGKGKGKKKKKKKERKSATERLAEKAKRQEWSRPATTVTKTAAADDVRSIVFGAMQIYQDHAWLETLCPDQKVKPAGARVLELALRCGPEGAPKNSALCARVLRRY